MGTSADRLRDYYARTASGYDVHEADPEHLAALRVALPLLAAHGVRRVLDVGCGTGKAMRAVEAAIPGAEAVGIDPSPDLLAVARDRHGHPTDRLHEGVGEALPFPDGVFDAALAVAVLHHVPDPWAVVAEMRRVAPIVVISDANRYGQGRAPIRAVKLALRALGLAAAIDRRRNGPDRHFESEGDGVAWPFSVFDLVARLRSLGDEVMVVPTRGTPAMHAFPLGAATHALLVSFLPGALDSVQSPPN